MDHRHPQDRMSEEAWNDLSEGEQDAMLDEWDQMMYEEAMMDYEDEESEINYWEPSEFDLDEDRPY